MEQGHNVPIKYEGTFFLKHSMADGRQFTGRGEGGAGGGVIHGGLISDHAKGGGVSQIYFSVIIFHSSNHEGIYT